jgi:hypothetical protein
MTLRKDWLKRINSIAHVRARSAYRDEKAKLMQDVRQALADGQDVAAFLTHEERADLRASLPACFRTAADERAAWREGTKGSARRDGRAPTKAPASAPGPKASTS